MFVPFPQPPKHGSERIVPAHFRRVVRLPAPVFRWARGGYRACMIVQPNHNALVVFGITGDLARKKIFGALYELARLGRPFRHVLGVGRSDWTTSDLRREASSALEDSDDLDRVVLDAFIDSLVYVKGNYDAPDTFGAIDDVVRGHETVLCYLAVPPTAFSTIADGIASSSFGGRARLLIEKPFGVDLSSARQLDAELATQFAPHQIFAVDHYLQKEALQALSFACRENPVCDADRESEHVESVEILMAEDIGIEGRGESFDSVGTLRDTIQNHGLQMLAAFAMDPPAADTADCLNDARLNILGTVVALQVENTVFGQYDGYLAIEGVEPSSTTETYVRATIRIANDRWRDVVFTLISGKALGERRSAITVSFRPSSPQHPVKGCNHASPRVFELSSNEAQTTGERRGEPLDPYARMFDDALRGDQRWFARTDVVMESWRIVQDVLAHEAPSIYQPGS